MRCQRYERAGSQQHAWRHTRGSRQFPSTRLHAHQATKHKAACTAVQATSTQGTDTKDQAVVIGSGIAGLAAAEMLSRHFSRVVVLEKDMPKPVWGQDAAEVAKAKTARRGVQQYSQIHVCIAQGLLELDSVFSGQYIPAVQEAGGNVVNIFTQSRYIHPHAGVWKPNPDTREPLVTAFATRHLLESTARKLVSRNDKVEIQYGAAVSGLQFDNLQDAAQDHVTVSGVHLSDGSVVPAALVVDCSGRNSRMTDWLTAAGFQKPRVAHATADCGYASWYTKLSPDVEAALGDVVCIYVMADAPERGLGIVVKVENGMWMGMVGGYEGLYPPKKDADLLDYARKVVWHPSLAKVLEGSTILAPVTRFNGLSSTWRHYEESALPEGLVMIGDAICSFSPIYGQGMTVAALEVAELDALLTQHKTSNSTGQPDSQLWLRGLSAEMQAAIYPIIRGAWDLAVGSDNKFTTAQCTETRTGVQQLVDKMMQGYLGTLTKLAAADSQVNETLIRVLHMLDPPPSLLQPAMLGRALLYNMMLPFTPKQPQQLYQYTAQDIRKNPETFQSATLQEMLLANNCHVVRVKEQVNGKSSTATGSAANVRPEAAPVGASPAGNLGR